MIQDDITVKGRVIVTLTDQNGNIKQTEFDNLVVATGKGFIASRMTGGTSAVMSHMGVGTGTAAATLSDTTLGSEIARAALNTPGGAAAGPVVTYQATFGAGVGTGAISEAAIFSGSANGTMLNRVAFPVVNKGANDSLAITWQITIQ